VGIVPAGLAARDSLRLEAGMALYGHELTRATTPFDAGLGRVVALGKASDFPGRSALAAAPPPQRTLVGVVAEGRRILRPDTALADPSGAAAGVVTSGAWSPTLERSIAMAYVAPSLSAPGTALVADVRGTGVAASVTALPFYSRSGGSA
jgi:aminomethyltransferase